MSRTLLIGGTGTVGREVLSQLSALHHPVRVMSRSPENAGFPPHTEVMRGDLTVPDTLDACLTDIDTVFLVWVAPRSAVAAALPRIFRRARRIVFLSAPLKTAHPLFQTSNPLKELMSQIEQMIADSGLEWSLLRPGMFAANARQWWGNQIRAGDVVRWPYLDVPTAPIDERDIAAVAVRALCEDGHTGAEYVLTGPQSLTHREQISTIGKAIGRSLRIEEITPDEARRELLSVIPALPAINMLLDAWAAASGRPAFVSSTLQQVTGAPPRTFLEWTLNHTSEFGRNRSAVPS